jgi:hypothetical protein
MQRALLALVVAAAGCKAGTTRHQELCARAASMFEKCEELDLGSGSDAPLTKELMLDRWRGLCRAAYTGETAQLMQNTRELFASMDEATKAGLRVQAECTAKATTCAEYKKCDE